MILFIWVQLFIAALFVWGAVVRANSHFRTPWLRYLFSVPAWFLVVAVIVAAAYRADMEDDFVALRPWKEFLDVVLSGRTNWGTVFAFALPSAALLVWAWGLRNRVAADGRRTPRARSWRWLVLLGTPLLLLGAIWGEIALWDRSIRGELAELRTQSERQFAEFKARGPRVSDERNAARLYREAWELLRDEPKQDEEFSVRGRILRQDWHGVGVRPLSANEERAAHLIIDAGRLPDCAFRVRPWDSQEPIVAHTLDELVFDLLTRRAALAADDATFRESMLAIRDFLTHRYREPGLRYLAAHAGGELQLNLFVAEIAARGSDRLAGFSREDLSRDDADAILKAVDEEVRLIDAENALSMSQLLDPGVRADVIEDVMRFGGAARELEFGLPLRWYQAAASRLDRMAKVSTALAAYRSRIVRYRDFVAATKAAGRPDWDVWRSAFADDPSQPEFVLVYDEILRVVMSRAIERYQVLSARRVGNTALAAAQFGRKHGRLPRSLDELVPEFLDAVPIDPMTGERLGMEVDGGDVILYSYDNVDGESRGLQMLRSDKTLNVQMGALRVRYIPK